MGEGDTVIGSSSSCGITLVPTIISGLHARVRVEGDQISIADEGSRNGTFVNDVRVAVVNPVTGVMVSLSSGDKIRLAEHNPMVFVVRRIKDNRIRVPKTPED